MMLGFTQTPTNYGGGGGSCTGDGVGAFTRIFTQSDLVDDIINVYHTFGTENVIVQVYDENNQKIIPSEISIVDGNSVDVSLKDGTPISGNWRVTVISETGGCNDIGSFARTFTQDDLVDDVLSVYHNLNSTSLVVQVYDENNQVVIPTEIKAVDDLNAEISLLDGTPIMGTWHLTIISASGYRPTPVPATGTGGCLGSFASYFTQGDLDGDILTVSHNLGSPSLIIQVYDESSNLVLPTEISYVDENHASISLEGGTPIQGTWQVVIVSTICSDVPSSGTIPCGCTGVVGSGATGSYTIWDEGDLVSSTFNTLNFVGPDVYARDMGNGTVNVYIPTPEFPEITGIPGETVFDGQNFTSFNLDSKVSGGYPDADYTWTVTKPDGSPLDFFVFNINSSRTVSISYPTDWVGEVPFSETVRFRAVDPSGFDGFLDVVYTLNPSPPNLVVPDATTYDPELIVFDMKTMVTDINHVSSEMIWSSSGDTLSTFDVSIVDGVVTISPKDPAWVGPAQLSEVITFYATDPKGLVGESSMTATMLASPPAVAPIPNQTIFDGQSFSAIDLDDFVSDMGHLDSDMVWTFTKTDGSPLDVYDVNLSPARVASVAIIDPTWIGTAPQVEVVRFRATDPKGLTDYYDVTFTTNPSPPITSPIPSQEVYDGQSFSDINLDNYVTDINHADNELVWSASKTDGSPLTVFTVIIVDRVASIVPTDEDWRGLFIEEDIMFTVVDPKGLQDTVAVNIRMLASPPEVSSIPNQSRIQYSYPANPAQGTTVLFNTIYLDIYVDDLNHTDSQIVWTATKTDGNPLEHYSVSIDSSRVATVTPLDNTWNGNETIRFTAEDPKELTDYTDVTFTITPTPYVSNFNTSDGVTDASVADNPITLRNIPAPTSEGSPFSIGSWTAGTSHPATRDTSWVYDTTELFLIESQTTTLTAEVLGADGSTVLSSNVINGMSGNTSVSGNVSISVSSWAFDYNLYKASVTVSVAVSSILPAGGRFTIRLTHDNGSRGVFTKTQGPLFYDPDMATTTIGNVEIREASISLKYLSGVRYYGSGSTLRTFISDIQNINDRSYPSTLLEVQGDFNLSSFTKTGSQLTSWNTLWDTVAADQPSSGNMTIDNGVYVSSGTISARANDWEWGPWVDSPAFEVNVDTSVASPTRIFEDFRSETYRYKSDCSTLWDSTQDLGSYDDSNGLQVYQDRLVYRSVDFGTYNPDKANQPNYQGYSGTGTYYRFMWHNNVSHSSGVIRFSDYNFSETEFQNGAVLLDISLDGSSWFSLNSPYFGGSLSDGDGCRVDLANNNITSHNRVKFTLGTGGFTSSSSNWGVFIRVRIPSSSSSKYMGQMEITDWV